MADDSGESQDQHSGRPQPRRQRECYIKEPEHSPLPRLNSSLRKPPLNSLDPDFFLHTLINISPENMPDIQIQKHNFLGEGKNKRHRHILCKTLHVCFSLLIFVVLCVAALQTVGVHLQPHSHTQPAGLPAALHAAPARQRAGRGPHHHRGQRHQPPSRDALQPVHPQERGEQVGRGLPESRHKHKVHIGFTHKLVLGAQFGKMSQGCGMPRVVFVRIVC